MLCTTAPNDARPPRTRSQSSLGTLTCRHRPKAKGDVESSAAAKRAISLFLAQMVQTGGGHIPEHPQGGGFLVRGAVATLVKVQFPCQDVRERRSLTQEGPHIRSCWFSMVPVAFRMVTRNRMQSAVAKAMELPSSALGLTGGMPPGCSGERKRVLSDLSLALEKVEHDGAN